MGEILQVQLYEDFAKSRAKCDVDETVSSAALSEETEKPKLKATGHVFQVQIMVFFLNVVEEYSSMKHILHGTLKYGFTFFNIMYTFLKIGKSISSFSY